MSKWTHIVGAIRFDGIEGMTPEPDLGVTVEYDDPEDQWDKCTVPCGSEGSITISTWNNPGSSLAFRTVSIFGDLRDYGSEEDEQEIVDYFNRIVKGHMVRQACYSYSVEYGNQRTFVYDGDKEEFVEWVFVDPLHTDITRANQ